MSSPRSVSTLSSKVIQIQAASLPGDCNSGPHIQLFALCEDGSIWCKYMSSGFSNVPTDGQWYAIHEDEAPKKEPAENLSWLINKKGRTNRGFEYISFCDADNKDCDLQQSSAMDDTQSGSENPGSSFVWLGTGENRMHLHRDHVHELIIALTKWLECGKII